MGLTWGWAATSLDGYVAPTQPLKPTTASSDQIPWPKPTPNPLNLIQFNRENIWTNSTVYLNNNKYNLFGKFIRKVFIGQTQGSKKDQSKLLVANSNCVCGSIGFLKAEKELKTVEVFFGSIFNSSELLIHLYVLSTFLHGICDFPRSCDIFQFKGHIGFYIYIIIWVFSIPFLSFFLHRKILN